MKLLKIIAAGAALMLVSRVAATRGKGRAKKVELEESLHRWEGEGGTVPEVEAAAGAASPH
jgi:hypothetical protein